MPKKLPTILRTKGLVLAEIGENEKGAYLKFVADNDDQTVREVTVYMQANQHVKWSYAYAIYDEATASVASYQGRYGDPARDHLVEIRGA